MVVSFYWWSPILISQLSCLQALGNQNLGVVMARSLFWAFRDVITVESVGYTPKMNVILRQL